MWNVILENMKNGVQTLPQFLKDIKSMCRFNTLPSCAQVSESFAEIASIGKNYKLKCMVPWLSAIKNHINRNYLHLWHASLN
jgi:hypothetical protein